ncbi:hypothetical protein AAAC51_06750 [Priestia megaterium]
MAMHQKLAVGTILFTYPEPDYNYYNHRYGNKHYTLKFKLLYVHNRRERSTGSFVSKHLSSTLNKLKIKCIDETHYPNQVMAVGCRAYTYHSFSSKIPYPTAAQVKEAQQKLNLLLERGTVSVEGKNITLIDNEFITNFKQKQMTNKDCLFSLLKPMEEYIEKETHY